MIDREERFLNVCHSGCCVEDTLFPNFIAGNCYFCALLYILCMLLVFTVPRVIVTGSLLGYVK